MIHQQTKEVSDMKQLYETPTIDMILLDVQDVISTSLTPGGDLTPGDENKTDW